MKTFVFKKVFINEFYTMIGKPEKEPVIKDKVDFVLDDYYAGKKSIEESESWYQNVVVDGLLKKTEKSVTDIDLLIGGDLNNQILASNYNASFYKIPFLGVYSACASFIEALIIGSSLIEGKFINNSIIVSSSHTLVNEKQFRFPIEYGCIKKKVNSFSTSGAVSAYLSRKEGIFKIESATIGRVIDMNHKDSNDMGAAMAPAAAEVILEHLNFLQRKPNYYDLILTGDLGVFGLSMLKDYLYEKEEIKLTNIKDSGAILYNTDENSDFAGGSGPICLPLILFNKILESKKYKKILIVGTGSLHSVVSVNLKKGMPGVAHAVSLEVIR